MSRRSGAKPWAPFVVCVGAAVAVSIGIDGPSLWTDEAATISASTRSIPELLRMAHTVDAVHAAYYALMHLWISIAGQSAVAIRVPSALMVGLSAAAVFEIGRRLGGRRGTSWGVLAAVTFTLLPRAAWMGIEARPFAFVTAATAWASVALLTALKRSSAPRWIVYGALASVAVVLNVYAAFVVVGHGVTVLALWGRSSRLASWFASAVGAALAASPITLTALSQSGQLGEGRVGLAFLARNVLVNQWFLGETPTRYSRAGVDAAGGPALWQVSSVFLAGGSCLLVALVAWRAWREGHSLARSTVVWLVAPWPRSFTGLRREVRMRLGGHVRG